MNSYTNYPNSTSLLKERQQLEKSLQVSTANAAKIQLLTQLKHWGVALVKFLAPSNEPRIKAINSANGTAWKVYDPVTQSSHLFTTEESLLIWLDQRYYSS